MNILNNTSTTSKSTATSSSFHTITTANYRQRLPRDVTDVYIRKNVLQLPDKDYKQIFKVLNEDVSSNNTVNVILPDSITEIQDEAFQYCNLIKSITIPNTVTRIGRYAFYCCENVESIKLSDNLQEIGERAFCHCRKLKEVVIPDSVTTLGQYAFGHCHSLDSVTLSKSLTTISHAAFHGCTKLQSINIPEGVTSIERNAFQNCHSLQSIVLPQTLEEIQQYVFINCYSLLSIYIPTSVITINRDAFKECFRLENIIIPARCIYYNSTFSYEKRIYNKKWNHPDKIKNHIDKIIQEEGPEWLKNRFDNLPLHQLCYNKDITIDLLKDIPVDDPFLKSVDKMNMTPLHVLSCNPNATLEMIQTLSSKCPDSALVNTKNETFPVELYLITKNIVQVQFEESSNCIFNYDQMNEIQKLMYTGTEYTIHDLIKYGLNYNKKLWDILLSFQGTSSLNEQLSSQDYITGLFPFMTVAVVNNQPLELVYNLAMMTDPTVI